MTKTHRIMTDLLLKSLLESSGDGILILDQGGNLLARSPRLETLLGIGELEPFSLPQFESALQELLPTEVQEEFALSTQLQQTHSSSFTLYLKNGRPLEVYSQPLGSFQKPQGRLWCFRNLVHQAISPSLSRGSSDASTVDTSRTQILSELTHDLRSPLCTLQMATQVLKQCIEDTATPLSEAKRKHAEIAIQLTRGAVNQINTLLTSRHSSVGSPDPILRQNSHRA
jgi:nitrogen-specific signal transduction histidine kinase